MILFSLLVLVIKYNDLTPVEQKQYEEKFGDPSEHNVDEIGSAALNKWLFNTNTTNLLRRTTIANNYSLSCSFLHPCHAPAYPHSDFGVLDALQAE